MTILNKSGIIGSTFLLPSQEYGQKFGSIFFKMVYNHETKLAQKPSYIQFACSVNYYQYENIMSYNGIINNISNQEDQDIVCKFKFIVAHEGPLIHYYTN